MSRSEAKFQARRAAIALAAMSAALLSSATVACAGDDDDIDILNPSWGDKLGDSIKHGIDKSTHWMGLGKPPPAPPNESPSGCPSIAILDGTQSQRVMMPGGVDNQGVRYQYSLFNVGRECTIVGGRIAMKIGADGRVLLGPAGASGRFDIPIRVVVFSELTQKPIESKLYRVSASVPAGHAEAPFQFVSESLVVPLAAGQTGSDYSIKVGFDAKGTDAATPAKHAHRKGAPPNDASAQPAQAAAAGGQQ